MVRVAHTVENISHDASLCQVSDCYLKNFVNYLDLLLRDIDHVRSKRFLLRTLSEAEGLASLGSDSVRRHIDEG